MIKKVLRDSKESGMTVVKRNYEDIESLLRRFKRKISNCGVLKDLRLKESYEKPGDKKRRKSREARKRVKRDQIKKSLKFKLNKRERGKVKNED